LISTLKKKPNATAIQRTNRFGLNATDRDRNRHRGRYRHRSRHRVGLWDPLLMRTNYKDIVHEYDVWHLAKSLAQK
jgi:hypothetical protein